MKRWALRLGCVWGLLLVALAAHAQGYAPPPVAGHVTDAAGKLSAQEIARLDAKLADYRRCSTNHVAVFIARSLEGYAVEDVAYAAFNRWKIGEAGKDNGALLVIAPAERKVRIETGKGVGGRLTDLQASDILRQRVSPRLAAGDFFGAVDGGTTGIELALGGCETRAAPAPATAPGATAERPAPPARPAAAPAPAEAPPAAPVFAFVAAGVLALLFVIGARADLFTAGVWLFIAAVFCALAYSFFGPWAPRAGAGLLAVANAVAWYRRLRGPRPEAGSDVPDFRAPSRGDSSSSFSSSSSSDSSWSSSSGDSSSSSDSGYSGGGGESGGGGASDSY